MTGKAVFKGITNGVKSAVKWSGDKLVDIAHSKTFDKMMSTLLTVTTSACALIWTSHAIWVLQFITVAPVSIALCFLCDVFIVLWCLRVLFQLMVNRAVDACFTIKV